MSAVRLHVPMPALSGETPVPGMTCQRLVSRTYPDASCGRCSLIGSMRLLSRMGESQNKVCPRQRMPQLSSVCWEGRLASCIVMGIEVGTYTHLSEWRLHTQTVAAYTITSTLFC